MKKLTPEGHEIINDYFKTLFEKIKDDNEIKDDRSKEKFLDLISSLNKVSQDSAVDPEQIDWNSFADAVIGFNEIKVFAEIRKNFPEFNKIIEEKMGSEFVKGCGLLGAFGL